MRNFSNGKACAMQHSKPNLHANIIKLAVILKFADLRVLDDKSGSTNSIEAEGQTKILSR